MRRTNLPGHALQSEGKPYRRSDEENWVRVSVERRPGSHIGVALCECGETSEVLESDGRRKAWHRDHKEAIRNG
jgi:hypothetical protein